jgi:anti-sigma regulatory factor (Ser/Thr protein kinase)
MPMDSTDRREGVPSQTGRHPPPDGSASLEQSFDANGLFAMRSAVAAHASRLGASERGVLDVTLIAHELASNAIQYAGGEGWLRLWRDGACLFCEVSDKGGGLDIPEPGRHLVEPLAPGGRGLWLVRRLSHEVHIVSGVAGTTITAVIPVEPLRIDT